MTDREKFEAWSKANTSLLLDRTEYPMTADEDQQYIDHDTNLAYMAYQAALASQPPADDGWVEWAGGDCPVNGSAMIQSKFRTGKIMPPVIADFWDWRHISSDLDIIAYRVVKP